MTAETYDDLKQCVGSKYDFTDDLLIMGYTKGKRDGYNQALDKVDDIITEQLDKSDNQIECQILRWVLDVLSDLII